ncbi:hypothetical protein BT93_I0680 [Corymbia citriodora subsp. variegata]|nr:hypothetical protein BT93_I0680 [Corymbia citriodora subsp. variegata]
MVAEFPGRDRGVPCRPGEGGCDGSQRDFHSRDSTWELWCFRGQCGGKGQESAWQDAVQTVTNGGGGGGEGGGSGSGGVVQEVPRNNVSRTKGKREEAVAVEPGVVRVEHGGSGGGGGGGGRRRKW